MVRMLSSDTSPEAHAAQIEVYRRMGPEARVELAFRMSDSARGIAAAGIQDRHPEYSDEEVRWALFRLVHGDDIFRKAWPDAPVLEP